MSQSKVYLDHAATTPVDPMVIEAMLPYFNDSFGNPSSVHAFGQKAEAAVEAAREDLASVLGCQSDQIIFTACGTESDNLALRGTAFSARRTRGAHRIITSHLEHHAVALTAQDLADNYGFEVVWAPADEYGRILPQALEPLLSPDVAVVSLMYANNEIGTLNPISALGSLCRQQGIPFHSDAVQAASQMPLKVDDLKVDMMSLGAHKFYGPKGVGALFIRDRELLTSIQSGGSQEFNLRPGTHNVPLIVGMAAALKQTAMTRDEHNRHYRSLRDRLVEGVLDIPGTQLTGHPEERLANHASFVIEGVDGNQLLAALDLQGFACSSGSACKTGDPEPSEVLLALGIPSSLALGSLRVTVGRGNTPQQIDSFCQALEQSIQRLRTSQDSA
jgi:cysteine desulfurase